jgi:hypothetical protein
MKRCGIGILFALLALTRATFASDPLPSWNDAASKNAVVTLVEQVTEKGSPNFVPFAERGHW